jgi:hypothetical protein
MLTHCAEALAAIAQIKMTVALITIGTRIVFFGFMGECSV